MYGTNKIYNSHWEWDVKSISCLYNATLHARKRQVAALPSVHNYRLNWLELDTVVFNIKVIAQMRHKLVFNTNLNQSNLLVEETWSNTQRKLPALLLILTWRLSFALQKASDLSIGYNLISTCAGVCEWLSRRKCICWWIIVCSNLAA